MCGLGPALSNLEGLAEPAGRTYLGRNRHFLTGGAYCERIRVNGLVMKDVNLYGLGGYPVSKQGLGCLPASTEPQVSRVVPPTQGWKSPRFRA